MLKPYKKDSGNSYTLGVYPTIELLKFQGKKVTKVYINPKGERNRGIAEILQFCDRYKIPVSKSRGLIEQMSRNENTYAIGVFTKYSSNIIQNENHVLLVKPSDAGNFGTICRTMLGFGVKNLAVIRPAVDIFDPKVVRSSMGAVFRMNYQYFNSFDEYKNVFKNNIYTFSADGDVLLSKAVFQKPFTLIFGNEGEGLGKEFKHVGTSVKIPQNDMVDSLNLSVSVGIALYQASNL